MPAIKKKEAKKEVQNNKQTLMASVLEDGLSKYSQAIIIGTLLVFIACMFIPV